MALSPDQPVRLPLFNPLETRTSLLPLEKDCRLYNAFAEENPIDQSYWIYKRAGLSEAMYSLGAGAGLGLYTDPSTGNVWMVSGNRVYSIVPGGAPSQPLSSVPLDTTSPYRFEMIAYNPAATYQYGPVFHNASSRTFYYITQITTSTGVDPQLNAVAIPTGTNTGSGKLVPGIVYLNGMLYVMDINGVIYGTNQPDDPTDSSWSFAGPPPTPGSTLNYVFASSNADLGVAIAKQLNYVVAIKQYTTQVWYDAGNQPPGSPLAEVLDVQIPFGCLVGESVQEIDSLLFWISSNKTISPQIIQLANLVPTIVSTPSVDRILDNITWQNPHLDVRSWIFKHGGHRFYGLTLLVNNLTLVYDIDQKAWYFWTDVDGNFWPIVEMAYQPPGGGVEGKHIVQHNSNGNIYQLDGDYNFPNDHGDIVPVDIYTPNFDAGIDRVKHLNLMRFNADQQDGSELLARYSDDDYQSWSNFRAVDLSQERPFLDQEGSFYRRAYHLRHQKSTALRIKTVDMQLDIGTL